MMEGRLGHPVLSASRGGESFVFLDIRADATKTAAKKPELNLSIVIDRSGSMRGKRLRNAIAGARTAIGQLSDGDVVSVISYSQNAQLVVSPTVISPESRPRVLKALSSIRAKGETCISCGIAMATRMARASQDKVNRVVLLSDGEATVGVRDVGGFAAMADSCRKNNVSITTIGVDVDYNERIMEALARSSNGGHHFAANPDALGSIFEREMNELAKTIAMNAEVTMDLAPGVFVDHVFDRSFERHGNRLIVPFGTFAQNDRKTLLVRLRVPQGPAGERPIADVAFRYDDLAEGQDGTCEGKLVARATNDELEVSELDGLVTGRLVQSETAERLSAANAAFARGDKAGARGILQTHSRWLNKRKRSAGRNVPMGRAKDLDAAFDSAGAALGGGGKGFEEHTPAREAASQVKQNQMGAFDLMQ